MFYRAPMQPVLILELLILLALANGTPVVAKRVFGRRLGQPLDAGTMFRDGPLVRNVQDLQRHRPRRPRHDRCRFVARPWLEDGGFGGAMAMAGDLFASFVKRRLWLISSSQAIGLDQIPESLFPLLACRLLMPITALDIATATVLFFVGELVLSRLLFK